MPTIIRNKLYRPRVTSDLIPLVRTHQTLDHDLDRPNLVCTPAGYGKTITQQLAGKHPSTTSLAIARLK